MVASRPYKLVYDNAVIDHILRIDAKHHSLVRATICDQLSFEPELESKNRKPLQRPADIGATWELRFGPANIFRVFYTVKHADHQVDILAIGIKRRNVLYIGGEEFTL